MDEKEAEARPVMGTIFLVIMASKPKTSVTAQEIPEDPHQSAATKKSLREERRRFLRSFQSDWFKKWPFLYYNESKLYFAIPVVAANGRFFFREFGSSFCKSCMLHCLNQDIHASFRFFLSEFIYDNLK